MFLLLLDELKLTDAKIVIYQLIDDITEAVIPSLYSKGGDEFVESMHEIRYVLVVDNHTILAVSTDMLEDKEAYQLEDLPDDIPDGYLFSIYQFIEMLPDTAELKEFLTEKYQLVCNYQPLF